MGTAPASIFRFQPPSTAAYCDVTRNVPLAKANGSAAWPWPTLQDAINSGATQLFLAPGIYGAGVVPAGASLVLIGGWQSTTQIGSLSGSGGSTLIVDGVDCNPLAGTGDLGFSDNNNGNLLVVKNRQVIAPTFPRTFTGGAAGGHGQIQLVNCDFSATDAFDAFSNWLKVIPDAYSERQMLAGGCTFTSTVAGALSL